MYPTLPTSEIDIYIVPNTLFSPNLMIIIMDIFRNN